MLTSTRRVQVHCSLKDANIHGNLKIPATLGGNLYTKVPGNGERHNFAGMQTVVLSMQ